MHKGFCSEHTPPLIPSIRQSFLANFYTLAIIMMMTVVTNSFNPSICWQTALSGVDHILVPVYLQQLQQFFHKPAGWCY